MNQFSHLDIAAGSPYPLGYSFQSNGKQKGVNFAVFSSVASAVELCLFFPEQDEIRLAINTHTNHIWHIWVAEIPVGTAYGFRFYGEKNAEKTARSFLNPNKLMLDPYAKAVIGKPDLRNDEGKSWFLLSDQRNNAEVALKGLIVDQQFDWQGTQPPRTPWAESIIYELHVKGFSQLQGALPEPLRGTYAGLAHPHNIAYFKQLGITAVELLPINYFVDEPHLQQKGLRNYWGYNPLAMFAVESRYSASDNPLTEFKEMVRCFHQAGIEVILDVVFNHSAESEQQFPTFSQRGIDDDYYYWKNEQGQYLNWTGCGNMLNLSRPQTRRWLLDCLCYWVEECHIDGFRFDLATVLGRESPYFERNAQLFNEIRQHPSLQGCKFIAEPWDIGDGGYQVGNFPDYFAEWNDRYRDDMCRFWLWKSGELGAFAERLAGSSDLFKHQQRSPHNSINFITAHDGFTLQDLLSYNHKQNFANGEDNRDGRDENYSYDHGFQGVENVPQSVQQARERSAQGLLFSLLLSNGVPMLLAGDEFGNSQYGNNNAYCQDNPMTWLKWENFNQQRFNGVKNAIALRKQIMSLQGDQWWNENNVAWLTPQAQPMTLSDWHNRDGKAFQVQLDQQWLFLINAKSEPQFFFLPKGKWNVLYGTQISNDDRILLDDLAFVVLLNNSNNDDSKANE